MKRSHTYPSTKVLPPEIEAKFGAIPSERGDLYEWLFHASNHLRQRLSRREILELLRAALASHGHNITDLQISEAIENTHRLERGQMPVTMGRSLELYSNPTDARRNIKARGLPMDFLRENPTNFASSLDAGEITSHIVQCLFPNSPQICAGKSPESMQSRPLKKWGAELSMAPYIDPWPMAAQPRVGKVGSVKRPGFQNTGQRRFLVMEINTLPVDDQAAILIHLADGFPLALVVDCGRGTHQGWYFVLGCPDEELVHFMRYAVNLGAAPRTWTRGQLVSTPFALRQDEGEVFIQAVPYFNPEYAANYEYQKNNKSVDSEETGTVKIRAVIIETITGNNQS